MLSATGGDDDHGCSRREPADEGEKTEPARSCGDRQGHNEGIGIRDAVAEMNEPSQRHRHDKDD